MLKVFIPLALFASAAMSQTIVEVAESAQQFNTLLAAVSTAGLTETLSGGEFTVFAPTDIAFNNVGDEEIQRLLLEENREELTALLLNHVVAGTVTSEQLTNAGSAVTLGGGVLTITSDAPGSLRVEDVAIIGGDVAASNGIIHVVDQVLIPTPADEGSEGEGEEPTEEETATETETGDKTMTGDEEEESMDSDDSSTSDDDDSSSSSDDDDSSSSSTSDDDDDSSSSDEDDSMTTTTAAPEIEPEEPTEGEGEGEGEEMEMSESTSDDDDDSSSSDDDDSSSSDDDDDSSAMAPAMEGETFSDVEHAAEALVDAQKAQVNADLTRAEVKALKATLKDEEAALIARCKEAHEGMSDDDDSSSSSSSWRDCRSAVVGILNSGASSVQSDYWSARSSSSSSSSDDDDDSSSS